MRARCGGSKMMAEQKEVMAGVRGTSERAIKNLPGQSNERDAQRKTANVPGQSRSANAELDTSLSIRVVSTLSLCQLIRFAVIPWRKLEVEDALKSRRSKRAQNALDASGLTLPRRLGTPSFCSTTLKARLRKSKSIGTSHQKLTSSTDDLK